jgi:signal transduction histidine kinase
VLLNLTANALKCTERGRVTVAARPRDEERVEFSVEDTGPGLDPEVVQALRDGLELERRRNGDGFSRSGLGLAIACKLVAAMGAELCVQSRPGEGTRFSFELELPRSEASPASGRASEDGRSGR